jgi:hypothetical protein
MSLSDKAMLVNLSISVWSARKYDKKVSQEIAAKHNTSDNVGRYNKNLLPVDAKSYAATVKAANSARVYHYANTLPWNDEGSRILPASNYMDYNANMRKFRADFEKNASVFFNEYPNLQANAKVILNGLYKEEDYPTTQNMARRFAFSTKFLPMPEASDFRVDIGQDEIDSIREQINSDTQSAVKEAMSDLYRRLYDAVTHMVEKLGSPDAIFRDSLIGNVRELCDLLPRLNLTGDSTLEAMRTKIEKELTGFEPQEIRNEAILRETLARKAASIQSDLAGYMGV